MVQENKYSFLLNDTFIQNTDILNFEEHKAIKIIRLNGENMLSLVIM